MLIFVLFSSFFFVLFANSRWLHDILYPNQAKSREKDTGRRP